MRNHALRHGFAGAALVLLAACTTSPTPGAQTESPAAPAPAPATPARPVTHASRATVTMAPASGSLVSGKLTVAPVAGGVRLTGEIGGLPRGSTHAIHIHEKGDCSAADATSAGDHFNPAQQPHGRAGAGAHHGGDMDNIVADAFGVARVDVRALGVTLSDGADGIGNRAVIVHAAPDDYTTQPTGNAGGRVACGVIQLVP